MKSNWDHWDDLESEEDSSEVRRKQEEEDKEAARLERKKKHLEAEDQRKFYVGEKVRVKEDFMSNSRPKRKILKDTYLYVIKKDGEGDLLVNDGTWEKNTWILKRQFAKIQYIENVKLKAGDILKVKVPFNTASKNPIHLTKGDIITVTRRDIYGDYSINNGFWEKNQWILRRHTYNVVKLQCPFQVGDIVKILDNFKGSSKHGIEFEQGMVVNVKKVDDVGDLSVNNGSWNKNQWITQKHFNKIAKLNAKDIVDVELLEPAATTSKNVSSVAFTDKNEGEGKPENASFGGVRQIETKESAVKDEKATSGNINVIFNENTTQNEAGSSPDENTEEVTATTSSSANVETAGEVAI